MDRVTTTLEHGRPEVVVEQDPRRATELLERSDVAAQEILERLVEEEFDHERARPGQHEHEALEAGRAPATGLRGALG